jgi:hypothetical protein
MDQLQRSKGAIQIPHIPFFTLSFITKSLPLRRQTIITHQHKKIQVNMKDNKIHCQ